MAVIEVSRARAGMVLAADVVDKRGRLLVPRGIELKEKHLGAFPAWGVSSIEVAGDEAPRATEVEPWAVESAERELAGLFGRTNLTHPVMAALHEVCVRRRALALVARGPVGAGS